MTNGGSGAAGCEYATRPDSEGGLLLVEPGTGLGVGLVLPGGGIYEGSNGLALDGVGRLPLEPLLTFVFGNDDFYRLD